MVLCSVLIAPVASRIVRGARSRRLKARGASARRGAVRCVVLAAALAAAVLVLPAAHSAGDPQNPGRRFLGECARDQIDASLTYRLVTASPGAYLGRELVVAGTISGVVQVGDNITYLVAMRDGSQASIGAQGAPLFSSGASVSALVRVPENWTSVADLDLIDMVNQYDIAAATPPPASPRPARATSVHSRKLTVQEQRAYLRAFYARQRTPSRSFSGAIRMGRQSLLDQYAAAVRYFNPHLPESKARTIAGHVIWYSQVNGVDARLVMAVIAVESGFDNRARSNKGAMGLGQLMPGTAKDLGVVNPYDPEQNIAGAVRLIRWNLSEFGNDDLALACYNAGENAVKRHHGIPPYQETIHYIQRVEELYHAMCRGGG